MAKAIRAFTYYKENGDETFVKGGEDVSVSGDLEAHWANHGLVEKAKPQSKKVDAPKG
jgi:hypothetical protein